MFEEPIVDEKNSIKLIIHITKLKEKGYTTNLEVVYPTEDDISIESLLAIRDGLDYCSSLLENIIDAAI